MHEVETPDGVIEFPDEMQPEEITSALNKQYGATPQQLASFSLAQGIGMPAKLMSTLTAGAEGSQMARDMEAVRQQRMLGADVEAPIMPATPEQLTQGLQRGVQFGLGKAQEFAESLGEMYADWARRTGLDPSAMVGRPAAEVPRVPIGISPLELLPGGKELKAGIETGAGKFLSGFTTPEQAVMLPFAGAKPVQAMFGAQALAQVPESIKALYQARTPQEIGEAGFGTAANLAMGGLIGRHLLTGKVSPYASRVEEAAKVYGDLRSRAFQGPGEVPIEEGRPGVLAPSEAVAEAAPVSLRVLDANELLSPVETALLQNVGTRHGMTGEIQVIENRGARDPQNNAPFESTLAEANPDGSFKAPGRMTISRDAFRKWIVDRTPETLPAQVASALAEEIIHSFTLKSEAESYVNTLTPTERNIRQKLYLGDYTPETVPGGFPEWKAGVEALRQHVQELMKLTPNEIIERARNLPEQWTKDGLYLIAKIIKRIREFARTKAAEEGQQISYQILDRMEQNVNAASQAIGEEAPFMISREEGLPFLPSKTEADLARERRVEEAARAAADRIAEGRSYRAVERAIAERKPAKETEDFITKLSDPNIRLFTDDAVATGLKATSIADLDRLAGERRRLTGEIKAALKAGDFNKGMLLAARGQLPREAIEAATNSGSHVEGEGVMGGIRKFGPRPLDWQQHPEVERWLRENGPDLGIVLEPEASAAMPRRREGREEPLLPGMAPTLGKGALTRPETVAAAARPPLEQLLHEPVTTVALDKSTYEHLSGEIDRVTADPTAAPPSFKDYAAKMRQRFGPMGTGALVESFERNLWPALLNASGERLSALREALRLGRQVGSREIAQPPARVPSFRLEGEPTPREEVKAVTSRQRYRNTVISAIARKLLAESQEAYEKPSKTTVEPMDIGFDRKSVQPAWNPIDPSDPPSILGRILTDDSREMGQPVSVTKRLTVLQDRTTGKVEMVSTYRDARRGPVLLDPIAPGKTHSRLETILKRYRPVYSILLDEPVKNFHQRFDSLIDFEDRFGVEARKMAGRAIGEIPAAAIGEEEIPSAYHPDLPITRAEAEAIVDHIEGEVGRLDSPEAVKASLESIPERLKQQAKILTEKYKRGEMPGPEDIRVRSAASAYLKQISVLADKYPDASVEELLDRLSKQIYENHSSAPDLETFVSRTMAQGRPEVSEAVPTGRPTAVPGRVEAVIPKLAVEPRVVPGGRPGAFIPQVAPERMLTPEQQAHVARLAAEEHPPIPSKYPAIVRYHAFGEPPRAEGEYKPLERAPGEEEPGATPEETAQMLSRRDVRDKAEARFFTTIGQVRSIFTRHATKQDIARFAAAASTEPINMSQQAKRAIELSSATRKHPDGDLKVLGAARAINAAYVGGTPDPARLADLHVMTTDAQSKAAALLRQPTQLTLNLLGLGDLKGASTGEIMNIARQWLHAAEDLQKEVEYAQAHFGEQDLMRTTRALRRELNSQLRFERNNGRNTKEAENYLPGLYRGEIYGDNSVTFQSQILGKQFGKPKSFANTYEAIQAGPFIPKLNNVAEIAAHRIRSGLNSILTDQAFHAPLQMIDPDTGTPVAIPMDFDPKRGYTVPPGMEQYVPVYPLSGGPPMAVRRSYAPLMKDLFGRSGLSESTLGRAAMEFGAIEKHTTLALDLYHLFKMGYFGAALMWERAGWKSGYTALEFRPENMAEAVRRGVIRQKDMDWALTPEQVNIGGQTQMMTHQEISKYLQRQGLNVGRVQDAMYKHFVDFMDVTIGGKRLGIGRYTRFLFDKFTRGIMNQAAVESFIRHNKDMGYYSPGPGGALTFRPGPAEKIVKRIVGDINTMFGSAGKQALIKNPTVRDISQLLLLAPQWTGTRISMESAFLSRLATTPYVALRYGLPEARLHAGPIGRAVGTGLLAMFGITQVLNMAFNNGKFTWQNPEEGHKLDAKVTINGVDHWISPLSVFMELTHDVARMMQVGRKDFMSTLMQIAGNKLHPVTRGIGSFFFGTTPTGQKITTFGGRLKALAGGLVPTPITLSAAARTAGHAITPRISPVQPGGLTRQLLSTIGVKSEIGERAAVQIQKLADDYMKRNNIKPPSGWQQIQTDEPNYSKLRSAIRAGDDLQARNLIATLQASHLPRKTKKGKEIDQVVHAMELYAKHNFTSKEDENDFYDSLTPGQKAIYEKSVRDRDAELQKFYNLYDTMPTR